MRQEPASEVESSTPHPAATIPDPTLEGSSRRGLLAGVGLAGLAGVVAACGGGSGDSGGDSGGGGGAGGGAGGALANTSDIPVGGGKVFKDEEIVVTQPKSGEFRAFSAICTHRGCTVGSVSGGTINCPCHGSKFSAADGAVKSGPATKALSEKSVKVEGNKIVMG